MTPKEKAKELVDKFYNLQPIHLQELLPNTVNGISKDSALICVDEILGALGEVQDDISDRAFIYYQEVKKEIENL